MRPNTLDFTIMRPLTPFMGRDYPGSRAYMTTYMSGELAITSWLYLPNENYDGSPSGMSPFEMPAPDGGALVVGHGGIEGVPAHYDYALRRLANSGWHIAAPSFRGETGSDGQVEFALGEVDDMIACWKSLTKLPQVDPQKTFLLGSSHGGMISLLALAREDGSEIPGAISVAAIYDVPEWFRWANESGHLQLDQRGIGMLMNYSDDQLRERSALYVAEKIEAPVYLFHGEADNIVPPEQTRLLAKRFDELGKANFKVGYEPGEDHEYIWGPDRPAAMCTWDAALRFIG